VITNPRALAIWAKTRVVLWPEDYLLIHLPRDRAAEAAAIAARSTAFGACVFERDEASLTVPREVWPESGALADVARVEGPFRALTLEAEVPLDLCGYLAPAAERLAAEGIPVIPQCAFLKDHILVPAARVDDAMAVLEGLIRGARVVTAEDGER
jgi:hypothetical protein